LTPHIGVDRDHKAPAATLKPIVWEVKQPSLLLSMLKRLGNGSIHEPPAMLTPLVVAVPEPG
jgi:hypothetical protein